MRILNRGEEPRAYARGFFRLLCFAAAKQFRLRRKKLHPWAYAHGVKF